MMEYFNKETIVKFASWRVVIFCMHQPGYTIQTCHLDDDSITLIQWDDERRLYDDESDIWKKENIDEL